MYSWGLEAGELLHLARRLMEIARDTLVDAGDPTLSPGELAVVTDVLYHPGSTVSAITGRTGFAQSRVSTALVSLRALGAIVTVRDEHDRRRTVVHPGPALRAALAERVRRPVDAALRRRLGGMPGERMDEVLAAMAELNRRLGAGSGEPRRAAAMTDD